MKAPLLIFLIFAFLKVTPQEISVSTKNKKAKKHFYTGLEHYNKYEYEKAITEFSSAIELDRNFLEAYQLLGTIYEEKREYEKAIEQYEKVLNLKPHFFLNNYYLTANLYMKVGEYEKAKKYYEIYIKQNPKEVNVALQENAKKLIKNAEFAIELKNNPVPFKPINLGPNINTANAEYSPTLTADEQTLYFTVSRPRDQYTQCANCKDEEDFYISKKINGEWTKAVPLGYPINSHGNEGAACISPDGMVFYFTACNRSDGYGSCDIYESHKENGQWQPPRNLGNVVNSNKWESQPSIAPDGKTLYFASNRNGSMDIFVTVKGDDGQWSTPVSLGPVINTDKSEMSPFIHPDGITLYFASDGHPGMGGMDIFFSQKQSDGTWSKPINLGYPINTHKDENFFIVNAKGNYAYFASDKLGGYGRLDLYTFELPEKIRPVPVTYLRGRVYDKETKKPLSANFELFDLETSQIVTKSYSDELDGLFLVSLPKSKNYALNVSKDGYLFYSENFSLENLLKSDAYEKDVYLQPIKKDEVVILKNIFFDTNKDELKPESFVELEKLFNLLIKNPKMEIEIRGHTDNVGTYQYNMQLSEKRALAVYNYLVNKGIDKKRLQYKGYGYTMPIDTNETEEGRANNRRTEFKVINF